MIYFISKQETLPLIWQMRGDTLDLLSVENVSAADEKPYYTVR
jgi:hypothetical protein